MELIIEELASTSNDQMIIIKGKRTKRPRPSSSASLTGSGGGGEGGFSNSLLINASAPTTSTTTQEDEDMANCLILLASGQVEADNRSSSSNTSRKFTEFYECKTCNRTFPSFQALGGHRASHKRSKSSKEFVDQKRSQAPEVALMSHPSETELDKKSFHLVNKPNKIHECSICGSEFGSGQALGGHMRRHRSSPASNNSTSTSTRIGASVDSDTRLYALDLNLPAPPEDEHDHQFPSKQQRPHHVFSAAALPLVDCYN